MPSDKWNSIMAIATGLISSLFNVALLRYEPFCQPQQLQCLYHLISFVLPFSFLASRWRFAVRVLWLQCETYASAVQAGALLMLFFAWNVSQMFKELEAKQSIMKHLVKATHPLLYQQVLGIILQSIGIINDQWLAHAARINRDQYLILKVCTSHSFLYSCMCKLTSQKLLCFQKSKQASIIRDHMNKKSRNKGGSLHLQIF